MSLTSARLGLSYLAEAQAQKHVTVNESLRRLDGILHVRVKSVSLTAEPGASEGDAYILPQNATGAAWSGQPEGTLMIFQEGAWTAVAPFAGLVVYSEEDAGLRAHDGSGWRLLSESRTVGVNASADAVNRLAVKSDAVLLGHDDTGGSGDVRVNINKAQSTGTASLVFQTNYTAMAEFGLAGTDEFSIKVRASDGTYRTALTIDRETGAVSMPNTA
ncbi:DUF2793 domain-containing protein [Parvularcula maris]|uniref:DUF2793 domain-containing protein n=1 Tax=Parvularcula maris TaxID=2965077 RepID=A0A9X2RIK6_9PROT|nr:DUF2793 domain-containing protein [Parvularcula maris]MCQ8186165.1 DUF2793 domain-containing protein [Parvularcula maris]